MRAYSPSACSYQLAQAELEALLLVKGNKKGSPASKDSGDDSNESEPQVAERAVNAAQALQTAEAAEIKVRRSGGGDDRIPSPSLPLFLSITCVFSFLFLEKRGEKENTHTYIRPVTFRSLQYAQYTLRLHSFVHFLFRPLKPPQRPNQLAIKPQNSTARP